MVADADGVLAAGTVGVIDAEVAVEVEVAVAAFERPQLPCVRDAYGFWVGYEAEDDERVEYVKTPVVTCDGGGATAAVNVGAVTGTVDGSLLLVVIGGLGVVVRRGGNSPVGSLFADFL